MRREPLPRRVRPGYRTVLYGEINPSRAQYRALVRARPPAHDNSMATCAAVLRGLRNL